MTLLRLIPAVATHRGMRRRHNEDAVGYEYAKTIESLLTHGSLFVVADGVGGLSAGDKASQMTVNELIREYYQQTTYDTLEQRLVSAIQKVNTIVFETLERKGATTLVAIVIHNNQMIAASVGDSQIFHIRNQVINQLNELDVLESDDADNGALTKAVGYRQELDLDPIQIDIEANDQILLCSDGLTRYLAPSQLLQLAQLRDPRDSVRRMINDANAQGGADNISALLVNIGTTIEPQEIPSHLKQISVRVAVDTDPMMMQDVPSKPQTQIPMAARPISQIDESILDPRPVPLEHIVERPVASKQHHTEQKQQNNLLLFIIVGIIILVIGAGILGVAFASLRSDDSPDDTMQIIVTDIMPPPVIIDNQNESIDDLQVGDIIVLDASILTKDSVAGDVDSFLTAPNTPYRINNITEDNEGRLWYRLLEENTAQTGWLIENNLGNYRLQNN